MSKDKQKPAEGSVEAAEEQQDTHSHLGNPNYPAAVDPATDAGGVHTATPTATQVGSATQLNAFYQELEDEISSAHAAVDEIANKAKAYVAKFQANE